MRYLLLLNRSKDELPQPGTPQATTMLTAYQNVTAAMAKAGVLVDSAPVLPAYTVTTVRLRNGETLLTDGPSAEIKEHLGGYTILECDDLDEALRWAARIPAAEDASVEVRPIANVQPVANTGADAPDGMSTDSPSEVMKTRTAYIKASVDEVWKALTDPELTVRYVGGRVHSTWRAGDDIVYLAPTSDDKVLEGRLVEVEPNRRLVLECRWLFAPELAADKPHRETFELEPMGELTKLTATFDHYEPGSPSFAACDLGRTGDSLKSLLETGTPLVSDS